MSYISNRLFLAVAVFFLLLITACSVEFVTPKQNDPDMNMGLAVDREKAIEFSNKLVEDVIAENHQEIYSKMSDFFRKSYSLEEIPTTFEKMNSHFGKLLETKYKTEEVGYWMFTDGTKKPMRKFFYSAKTEKAEMGKYILQVSVILENEKLSCASFSLLDFPMGLPEKLK
jgi:hypothetical protein